MLIDRGQKKLPHLLNMEVVLYQLVVVGLRISYFLRGLILVIFVLVSFWSFAIIAVVAA